jgi:phosphoserine phosphatase RsbU/P
MIDAHADRPSRPAIPRGRRADAWLYAVLIVLFLLATTVFVTNLSENVDVLQHDTEYARPPFYLGDANWGSVALQPEAEASGMKFSDVLLNVNGRPMDGFFVYYGTIRQARAADRLQVRVRAQEVGAPAKDLTIVLRPYRDPSDPPPTLSDHLRFAVQAILLPVVCIGLGFWVAAVRIRDRSAWLFLLLMLGYSTVGGPGPGVGIFGQGGFLQPILAGFAAFRSQTLVPALMLFAIAFPERLRLDLRYPWLKWIVAGYLFLVAALVSVDVSLWPRHLTASRGFTQSAIQGLTGVEGDFGAAVLALALLIAAGSLGWKAFTARRDARRRLLLLFLGSVPGVAALLIVIAASRFERPLPTWSLLPLLTMMLSFPLAMAYVIVVHRAMDVRVVIRQGLQYVLARGGIRAVQLGLLVAISVAASSFLARGVSLTRAAIVVGGLAAIVAVSGRFAEQVRSWVDRRFFREAYQADAILSDLARRVRTIVETGPLLETVATRIADSLHVPRIAILLNEGGAFRPAFALGYPNPPAAAAIPVDGATVERLQKQPHAFVELENSDSWTRATADEERASLELLQAELLLPLSLNQQLLGIMSLGAKQSEAPYSNSDIRLLDSVAVQTGLALENGRLTEAIKKEVAGREKQRRELEIASEVQQRLFPQEYPPIAGVDYAGGCRPALGVGGDYYDFILRKETGVGIAIGDVSGKGIPAALLMATLRAFLRGQTLHRRSDLAGVMANLNALVFESSSANRYATFFYGELDCSSRTLTYVNCGHNAPMIFRQSGAGGTVLRLDTGGPVIGLMEDCVFEQACVALEAGDVLVAFTDGISEAMNGDDEEWGEERLMEAVRANSSDAARTLIDHLMDAADQFVSGAPQHDDMTLVVVRLL